ncbi:immunoglobulin kappa light chain-like isoform X1 [Tympanuchus pallidicinctus]|uniref:immunoglobulin kappa light chain-like isoform X1 n=1 Tax=Tympanuchus pallidicinctus TaxID=109042 RepID=UPI00228758E7|nr:immunoglobulin kappa light chain-like isoform X1 [Tympanuchus pallidicinctus]
MLLLAALMVATAWSYGHAQETPIQSPVSITVSQGNADLKCHFKDFSGHFDSTVIHWYQQKENKAPVRMIYFSSGTVVADESFQRHRYRIQTISGQNLCTLTIRNVIPDDAATYYCAYWDPHMCNVWIKYFGTGTKLIVSNKGNSGPENSEILRKEHKNQLVYVCLFEKFYPEVVRVKWLDEAKKEVTQNVVKGDVWKFPGEEKYSVSSWLSVPLEDKNKKYSCHFEHESGDQSLLTHVLSSESSPQKNCSTESRNSTVFNRDHLTHKAAQLVYVVLLLKSSMYYVIILFFFFKYRARNAAKPSGKRT